MTTHDESPIIRTSKKRMAQGIAIVVGLLAIGTAIIIPFWNFMDKQSTGSFLDQTKRRPA